MTGSARVGGRTGKDFQHFYGTPAVATTQQYLDTYIGLTHSCKKERKEHGRKGKKTKERDTETKIKHGLTSVFDVEVRFPKLTFPYGTALLPW